MNIFYIISKLFTYLVLPPGIFILIFLVVSFYIKKFKTFFLFCALCFYFLSNSYVADLLLSPLELPYNKNLVNKHTDGVIVLGGGNIAGSVNLPLGADAYKRAMYGFMIAKSKNIPLLYSGGGAYKRYTEAAAFKDSMNELKTYLGINIPFSKKLNTNKFSLHVEEKSLNTYQNALFSKEAFKQLGIKKPTIYLVTSAYHMKRSIMLYKYFGFKVIPAATDFKISNRPKNAWGYLPNISAFNKSYIALHEYAGIFSLFLRGII